MKTYRVYFNRERDWPQCWSVDEGDQASEINVCGFRLEGVTAAGLALSKAERAKLNGQESPFAWIEVTGELEIKAGIAVFRPARGRRPLNKPAPHAPISPQAGEVNSAPIEAWHLLDGELNTDY